MGEPLRVGVLALDPMLDVGVRSALCGCPEVSVVLPGEVAEVMEQGVGRTFPGAAPGGRPGAGLTERGHAVLALIAEGRETEEIARELCYSPHRGRRRARRRPPAPAAQPCPRRGLRAAGGAAVNAWEAAVPVRVHAAAPDPGTRNRAQAVACAVRAGLI